MNGLRSACINHVKDAAEVSFQRLEESLIGPNISSATLGQQLEIALFSHVDNQIKFIGGMWENEKGPGLQSYYRRVNFNELKPQLMLLYRAKINQLCRKLAVKEKSQNPVMSIGQQNNFSGSSNNIQIGNHNQQTISAINTIQTAIDASAAPPEQKTEVKSQFQKFLSHPATVGVLGKLAEAGLKTIVP